MTSRSNQNRREGFSLQLLQIIDALIVWASFSLAATLRDSIADVLRPLLADIMDVSQIAPPLNEVTWLLMLVIPFTPLTLEMFGFYRVSATKPKKTSIRQILQSIGIVAIAIGMAVLVFKFSAHSRLVLASALIIAALLLFIRDRLTRGYVRRKSLVENLKERVILAGGPDDIEALFASFPEETTSFWNVVERFDLTQRSTADLADVIAEHSVERVIFSAVTTQFDKVSRAVEVCESQGVEAWVQASFIRTNIARPEVDVLGGQPMLVLRTTPEISWALLVKGIIDRFGALVLIVLTSPLWIFAFFGILLTSPGASPFFRQQRAGRYGKPFSMWKFRTMVVDAEALLDKLKAEQGNEMSGPVFKLQEDPRVFKFGRLLRKLSIDELPQLINVLIGDMSLVGPRPLPVYEVEQFEKGAHRRRLSMKPGITCTWQAGGRNKITDFEDWVKMDLEYIDNWSLGLDAKLLFQTVPAVLFAKGAK